MKTETEIDKHDRIMSIRDLMEIMPFIRYKGKVYSSVALVALFKVITDDRLFSIVVGNCLKQIEAKKRHTRKRPIREKHFDFKEYYRINQEKIRKYRMEYYRKNKDKEKAYQRKLRIAKTK